MRLKRRSPQQIFEFFFHPLGIVDGIEYDLLAEYLVKQVQIPAFKLHAWRRRNTWAIELPAGAFSGDLSGAVSLKEDLEERERILRMIKSKTGAIHMDRSRDMIEKNGVWYYRRKALEQFRIFISPNLFFASIYKLLLLAEKDPTLIIGEKKTTARPITERPIINGRRAPGPRWTAKNDYVLKKWFGKWPDGKHHPLTDTQWATVLEELGGFRSKHSVKHRLSVLNATLKKSLLRDGYIHRDDVKKYQDGFLGEMAVVPRFRPRLHGSYYPEAKRRNPSSTLLKSDGTSSRRTTSVNEEAKQRILENPPEGFHPTTVLTHLDELCPIEVLDKEDTSRARH